MTQRKTIDHNPQNQTRKSKFMNPKILFGAAALVALLAGCGKQAQMMQNSSAAGAVTSSSTPTAVAEGKILKVSNWPDYLPEGILADFEKETGIKVVYKTFSSNEGLHRMLSHSAMDADIVVPGSNYAAIQIGQGLLRPLDRTLIPNTKNLDPSIMKLLSSADASNAHLIPWAWGLTTVGINRTKVQAALGDLPFPDNSWDLVFNPKYTAKLKTCGIVYLDSPGDVIPAAAHYAGMPAYSNSSADHEAAAQVIRSVRGDIRRFSSDLIGDIAAGKICAALGWSGDFNQAADQARKAGSTDVIEALLPSTGALSFFDTMAIPKTAKHPNNAHAFINFMLRPENAARMVTDVGYPTGNMSVRDLVSKDIANNQTIFVSEQDIAKLLPPGPSTNIGRASMIAQYMAVAYGLPTNTAAR